MNIPLGPLTIKLDVLIIQIINIAILLFLFKKLFGDVIIAEIKKRKELLHRISNADNDYKEIIDKAHQEKEKMIEDGKKHKDHLLQEAKIIAKKTEESLIEKARKEADTIIVNAQSQSKIMENTLVNNFESSVKHTAKIVVKKLLKTDKDLQSAYLDTILKEAVAR